MAKSTRRGIIQTTLPWKSTEIWPLLIWLPPRMDFALCDKYVAKKLPSNVEWVILCRSPQFQVNLHQLPDLGLLSIYLSIYGIYIARLQGNYSEALPAQAPCYFMQISYEDLYRTSSRILLRDAPCPSMAEEDSLRWELKESEWILGAIWARSWGISATEKAWFCLLTVHGKISDVHVLLIRAQSDNPNHSG